jgi:hypothetical protein
MLKIQSRLYNNGHTIPTHLTDERQNLRAIGGGITGNPRTKNIINYLKAQRYEYDPNFKKFEFDEIDAKHLRNKIIADLKMQIEQNILLDNDAPTNSIDARRKALAGAGQTPIPDSNVSYDLLGLLDVANQGAFEVHFDAGESEYQSALKG